MLRFGSATENHVITHWLLIISHSERTKMVNADGEIWFCDQKSRSYTLAANYLYSERTKIVNADAEIWFCNRKSRNYTLAANKFKLRAHENCKL